MVSQKNPKVRVKLYSFCAATKKEEVLSGVWVCIV